MMNHISNQLEITSDSLRLKSALTVEEFPQIAMAVGKEFGGDENASDNSTVVPLPTRGSAEVEETVLDAMMMEAERGILPALGADGNVRSLQDVEGDLIRFAIDHHNGRMTRVARSLEIDRSTLYRKLKELGIDAGEPRETAKKAATG